MALFEIKNLEFNSKSSRIIKDITLDIQKSIPTCFWGQSGCGKSTLLKLIAGIYVPNHGKVIYNGRNIADFSKAQNLEFRKKSSFVFQDAALWANQDIRQNLMLPLKIHFPKLSEKEINDRIEYYTMKVDFDKPLNLRPVDLSSGEQKKIAFARALVSEPEILFLDECTASLDTVGSAKFVEILHEFVNKGNTIIYVTHSSSFVEEFPGDIFLIEDGSVKEKIGIKKFLEDVNEIQDKVC